jgi:hypothetical protein
MGFVLIQFGVGVHLFNKWPARKISIDHQLEDVIVEISFGEIPVIIVSFVEEIKPIETLDPADAHPDIQIFCIYPGSPAADRIGELVGSNDVFLRYDFPVISFAVNPGNHVGRKLENLKFDIRPFQRLNRQWGQSYQEN